MEIIEISLPVLEKYLKNGEIAYEIFSYKIDIIYDVSDFILFSIYLIIQFMVQKRMLESFCFDDIIKNFMIFIEPEAQSHKNARILEISKNFQFFCDIQSTDM